MSTIELPYQLTLRIPFESKRQSSIAKSTLSPDPILKPTEISINYEIEDIHLVCQFKAVSDRVIRVAVSNVIDNIKTIIECMDDFDGKNDVLFEESS